MRLMTTAIAVAAVALAGCGGDSGSKGFASNDARINKAQQSEASAETIHAKLERALQLHHYAGVDDAYTVPVGSPDVHQGESGYECNIDGVYIGQQARMQASESNALVSADGNAVVEVGTFQGTPTSVCIKTAKHALGW
jgi:histidine ammonia-lyase